MTIRVLEYFQGSGAIWVPDISEQVLDVYRSTVTRNTFPGPTTTASIAATFECACPSTLRLTYAFDLADSFFNRVADHCSLAG